MRDVEWVRLADWVAKAVGEALSEAVGLRVRVAEGEGDAVGAEGDGDRLTVALGGLWLGLRDGLGVRVGEGASVADAVRDVRESEAVAVPELVGVHTAEGDPVAVKLPVVPVTVAVPVDTVREWALGVGVVEPVQDAE